MKLRKGLLKESWLYVIIDKKAAGRRPIFDIVNTAKHSAVDIIQFRDKESKKEDILKNALLINKSLLNTKLLFIVNDYLDIAKLVDCDGIHLGQDDTSIELARKVLGKDKIIGISCHSLKQALNAQDRGADYISIGPIFSTPVKPQYDPIGLEIIKRIKEKIKLPFFVIGNINKDNMSSVLSMGAKRIAVCRGFLQ